MTPRIIPPRTPVAVLSTLLPQLHPGRARLGPAGHPPRRSHIAPAGHRRPQLAALALALLLGLAFGGLTACDPAKPSQKQAAPAAAVDACTLLTAADVATVTKDVSGSLSSTLEDAVGRDPALCTYALPGVPPRVISLAVRRQASAEAAAEQHQTTEAGFRSLGAGTTVEEVPGLGDAAFWAAGQIDQLHLRRGDTLLILTVQLDQEPKAAARSLATRVLDHLAHPSAPAAKNPAARPAATHPAAAQTPGSAQAPASQPSANQTPGGTQAPATQPSATAPAKPKVPA